MKKKLGSGQTALHTKKSISDKAENASQSI